MTTLATPTERQSLIRDLAADFSFFAKTIWNTPGLASDGSSLEQVAPLGRVETDMLNYLGDPHGPAWRGVLSPRGAGKSHFAQVVACHRLFRDPDCKVGVISKSEEAAKMCLDAVRKWIERVPMLQHLRPSGTIKTMRGTRTNDSTQKFTVGPAFPARQPSFVALGVGGQTEGNHFNVLIVDDIETDETCLTYDARQKVRRRSEEFIHLRYPDAEIVVVGTFHDDDSIYKFMASTGYEFRTYPMVYPEKADDCINLAPMLAEDMALERALPNEPVFDRFPAEKVAEARKVGQRGFRLQYALAINRKDDDSFPLKLHDLMVMPIAPDRAPIALTWGVDAVHDDGRSPVHGVRFIGNAGDYLLPPVFTDKQYEPYTGVRAFLDTAGTGDSELALSVSAHLNGNLFVPCVVGMKGGPSDANLKRVASLCRTWRVNELHVEDNFGRGMFRTLLQPHVQAAFLMPGQNQAFPNGWSCAIVDANAYGQKEQRICDILEPVLAAHRMAIDPNCLQPEDGIELGRNLQYQIANIARAKGCLRWLDRVDSLASCVGLWSPVLCLSPAIQAQESRRKAGESLMDRLRRRRQKKGRWFIHRGENR